MNLFVTAIGTDSGKTLASAILVQALGADYWKPIQAGSPTDFENVKSLVSRQDVTFHPSLYNLKAAMSPHAAAALEGVEIDLHLIRPPVSDNHLIIEGAGGIMVPLNERDLIIDIASFSSLEVILVCNLYLGSINHSLLSISELIRRNIRVKGIIFNGPENQASTDYILKYSGWDMLYHVPQLDKVNKETIAEQAELILPNLLK
jgi:dethiobiotin synthetase